MKNRGQAVRSYCAGVNHRPVSTAILNAVFRNYIYGDAQNDLSIIVP